MNFKNIKSNQIILFVVALMLVSAGYLSYSMRGTPVSSNIVSENEVSSIGDARLVSSNNVIDSNSLNEVSVATSSSSSSRTDDYFASSRLGRDTMYSQMIESYQKIIDKTKEENITCNTALEQFYEDKEYIYYFPCIKSKNVIVIYSNGYQETVATSLEYGDITIEDLERNNIEFIKHKKDM